MADDCRLKIVVDPYLSGNIKCLFENPFFLFSIYCFLFGSSFIRLWRDLSAKNLIITEAEMFLKG